MAQSKYKAEAIAKYLKHIVQLDKDGLRPVSIAAELRGRAHDDPKLAIVTVKQIHNALARHGREELASLTRSGITSRRWSDR